MRNFALTAAFLAAATLAAGAAAAQDTETGLARFDYWSIKAGTAADFEKGLKAHNELHREQGDPHALYTWQVVTGKRAGQYLRGSFGHRWSDFDVPAETRAADDADAAVHVDPYIESAEPAIYRFLPAWSKTATDVKGPAPLAQIFVFHVEFGRSGQFVQTVAKIHAALSKADWPDYYWYQLVDGGEIPTYVLTVPKGSWAEFAPPAVEMPQILAREYGEEQTGAIFGALSEVVEEQIAYTIAYREDLSYLPAGD